MSVLNRKMFANGSEVTGQVDSASVQRIMPSPDNIRRLIEFYVADGMNATDIQERLATINGVSIPMATVEQLVIESGGSVNPSVNTNKFRLPPPPETVVTPEGGLPGIVQPAVPDLPTVSQIENQNITPITLRSGQDIQKLQQQISIMQSQLSELEKTNRPVTRFGIIPKTKDGKVIRVNDEQINTLKKNIEILTQSLNYLTQQNLDVLDAKKPDVGDFLSTKVDTTIAEDLEKVDEKIEIDEKPPEETKPDEDLPEVAKPTIGAQQYKDSKGTIHNIDPAAFRELLSKESSRIIQGILLNPNVEYGQNLIDIIEAEALGRSSTLVDPEKIKVGGENIILNPEALADETLKFIVDIGKEGVEGLYNTLRSLGGSRMVGIFRGREAGQRAKEAGRDEYKDLFDTPLTGQGTIAENLAEIGGYGATGGETAGTLDNIVLETSLGVDTTQSLTDIANEEKTVEEQQEQIDEAAGDIKETPTEETKDVEDEGADEDETKKDVKEDDKKDDETGASAAGITVINQDDNDGAQEVANSIFGDFTNFFNSEANLRMARNVGKALTATGDLTGIGLGAAAAAEERKLEKELAEKRLFDLAGKETGLDFKNRKDILDVETKMNTSIRDYNNAVAAQGLVDEVLRFANSNDDLTTFAAKIGATVDDLLVAAKLKKGTDVTAMSDTKRAQIALDILTNRNIKEILGESGRTISNIDRDIAKRIVGDLSMTKIQSVAELKQRLEDNLQSILAKKSEAQRNIKSSVRFLAPYDPDILDRDTELFSIYVSELGFALPNVVTGSDQVDDAAIQIDAT